MKTFLGPWVSRMESFFSYIFFATSASKNSSFLHGPCKETAAGAEDSSSSDVSGSTPPSPLASSSESECKLGKEGEKGGRGYSIALL